MMDPDTWNTQPIHRARNKQHSDEGFFLFFHRFISETDSSVSEISVGLMGDRGNDFMSADGRKR